MEFQRTRDQFNLYEGLSTLPEEDKALLLFLANPRKLKPGFRLMDPSDTEGDQLYLALSGRFHIIPEGRPALLKEAPILLGEIAIVSPSHSRTATVITEGECEVLEWNYEAIRTSHPHLAEHLRECLTRVAWPRIVDPLG